MCVLCLTLLMATVTTSLQIDHPEHILRGKDGRPGYSFVHALCNIIVSIFRSTNLDHFFFFPYPFRWLNVSTNMLRFGLRVSTLQSWF